MSAPDCTACGKPKPVDRFRACPDCRAEWRLYSRKPGGPAETLEALRAENARLRDRNKKLKEDRKILSAQVKNLTAMFDAALDMLPASQGVLRKQMEKRRARIAGGG